MKLRCRRRRLAAFGRWQGQCTNSTSSIVRASSSIGVPMAPTGSTATRRMRWCASTRCRPHLDARSTGAPNSSSDSWGIDRRFSTGICARPAHIPLSLQAPRRDTAQCWFLLSSTNWCSHGGVCTAEYCIQVQHQCSSHHICATESYKACQWKHAPALRGSELSRLYPPCAQHSEHARNRCLGHSPSLRHSEQE